MANYIKRDVGRPLKRNNLPIRLSNFVGGTRQYLPSIVSSEGNIISRSINIRCTHGSTIDRRKGKIVFGTAGDAGKVYMEAVLQVSEGTDIQLRLVEGSGAGVQLQKYNGTDWQNVGNNIGTADDRIDWFWTSVRIAGEDRLYFTNGVSDLRYTNGTEVTTVEGIKARYITNVGDILVLGHTTSVFGPNEVVFAKANSHQFYSDLDDGYPNSTQRFVFPGEVTQVKGFNSYVYVFTKSDGTFEVDLSSLVDRQISTHGTIAPKSVAVGWDMMVWCDQDGIWALPINGNMLKISKEIDNIYSQTSVNNLFQIVCGFNTSGQLEVHLGNLTYEGVAHEKYSLIYEVDQSRFEGVNIWREDEGREFPNNMVNWTNSWGFTQTYYGSRTNQTTYQSDYGYEDGAGVGIKMTLITKDFKLAEEKEEAHLEDVYVKYEPGGVSAKPLTVFVRTDTGNWRELKTINLSPASRKMNIAHFQAPPSVKGRFMAFKLESTDNKSLRIYEIYATYNITDSEVLPS